MLENYKINRYKPFFLSFLEKWKLKKYIFQTVIQVGFKKELELLNNQLLEKEEVHKKQLEEREETHKRELFEELERQKKEL